jgi:hypothetical protein
MRVSRCELVLRALLLTSLTTSLTAILHIIIIHMLYIMYHSYLLCNRWRVTNGKKCQTLTAMRFSPASHQQGAQRLLACTAHDGGLRVIDYDKQELVVSLNCCLRVYY